MSDTRNPVISLLGSNFMVGDCVIISDVSPNIMATGSSLGSGLFLGFNSTTHEGSHMVPFGQFKAFKYCESGLILSYANDSSSRIYVVITALDEHLSFHRACEDGYVNFCVDTPIMEDRGSCQAMVYMQAGYDPSQLLDDCFKVFQQIMELERFGQWKPFHEKLKMEQLADHNKEETQLHDDEDVLQFDDSESLPSNNTTAVAVHDEVISFGFRKWITKDRVLNARTKSPSEVSLTLLNRIYNWDTDPWETSPTSGRYPTTFYPTESSTADCLDSLLHLHSGEIANPDLQETEMYTKRNYLSGGSGALTDRLLVHPRFIKFRSPAVAPLHLPAGTCMPPCGGSQQNNFHESAPKNLSYLQICIQETREMMKYAGEKVDTQVGAMIVTTFVANTTVNCKAAIHNVSRMSWLDYVKTGISGLICVLMISSWMIKPTRYSNLASASCTANRIKDRREELSHLMAGASITCASLGIFSYVFMDLTPIHAFTAISISMILVLVALFYGSTSSRMKF